AADDQRRAQPERLELRRQRLGLVAGRRDVVEDHQLAGRDLARQRRLERQLAHLLRQVNGVAAHHRAEDLGAAAELRRAQRALTGAPRALLPVRLLGRAADLADALGLVRAGPPLG